MKRQELFYAGQYRGVDSVQPLGKPAYVKPMMKLIPMNIEFGLLAGSDFHGQHNPAHQGSELDEVFEGQHNPVNEEGELEEQP